MIVFIAVLIPLLATMAINQEIIPHLSYLNKLLGICLFIPLVVYILAIFRKEEHSKTQIGVLEIDTEKICWNNHQMSWDEIEEISISYSDYEGRLIKRFKGDFRNHRSNGLDNEISIKLKDSTNYSGNIFIESEEGLENLKNVLWAVVGENNISLNNAKKIINPRNYKEHQELKKRVNKL